MFAVGSPSPPRPIPMGPSPHSSPVRASPAGLLMSDIRAGFNKKSNAKWAAAGQYVATAEMIVGALIFVLSMRFLYQFTEATGVVLGLLLLGSGVSGVLGCRRRSSNIVNLQLVGSIVGIVLAFEFMAVVVRDVQVDCALAELYHRGLSTQRQLAEARQGEAMNSVYTRLGEMEDMLSLVQQGTHHQVQLAKEQEQLRITDMNYIRAKVDMVKRHAEELQDSVLKNHTITEQGVDAMDEEQKAFLRRRLDVADKIIDRISKHHTEEDRALSLDEYTEILDALTHDTIAPELAAHPELAAAKAELPNMAAAMQRQHVGQYDTLLVGSAPEALQRLDAHRAAKRQDWENRFGELLKREMASGDDYLADLPEHCVRETRGERLAVAAGLAAVAVQLVGAYVSLSLTLRLPAKAE